MDKIFSNKNLFNKVIVYTSAAMIFTATPALSVSAVEANTQTSGLPAETATPQESQPASNAVPTETTDNNPSNAENVPAPNTPTPETPLPPLPTDTTTVTPQTPTDVTTTVTPQPAPSEQPLPEQAPADQGSVAVTPMQATVYAASQKGLNIRSGPSTSHSKLGTLKYGEAVTVIGKTADNWYQIQYSGNVGYVLAQYVSDTPLASTENSTIENPPAETPISPDTDVVSPDSEAVPAEVPGSEADDDEAQTESDSSAASTTVTTSLLGAPVVIVLAIAIVGVISLIGYSVYGLFKKDNTTDAYDEEEYFEDGQYPDNGYYGDESYSDDDYYEEEPYSDDDYYEDEPYDDDRYYEEEPYSDDDYYEPDDRKH